MNLDQIKFLEETRSMINQILGDEEQYLTIDEAADFLRVKRTTLYKKEMQSKLPVVRGMKGLLFRKSDLIKFLNSSIVYPANWEK